MSHLDSPVTQIEYEIYLLSSQAESLLQDLHNKKSPKTFKKNIRELKLCQALLSTIIHIIEKELE